MNPDKVTLNRINFLHPKLKEETLDIYLNKIIPSLTNPNVYCRFAYTLRSFSEQQKLYEQGRSVLFDVNGNRLGIVTDAKPGESFHNYGLALDIVLINKNVAVWDSTKDFDNDGNSDWMEIVKIFKDSGWIWGGDFKKSKDKPHFEKSFGLSIRNCLSLKNSGKVDQNGYILI